MKLEKWAFIAEIVLGVAVLTTLIFLVVGIRDRNSVNRFLAYERILESANDVRFEFLGSGLYARTTFVHHSQLNT